MFVVFMTAGNTLKVMITICYRTCVSGKLSCRCTRTDVQRTSAIWDPVRIAIAVRRRMKLEKVNKQSFAIHEVH